MVVSSKQEESKLGGQLAGWGHQLHAEKPDWDSDRESHDDAMEISHPTESAQHLLFMMFGKLEINQVLYLEQVAMTNDFY